MFSAPHGFVLASQSLSFLKEDEKLTFKNFSSSVGMLLTNTKNTE